MISFDNPLFVVIALLAAYGLITLIGYLLEYMFRKTAKFPDKSHLKVIVAVKNAEEYIESAADEIIRNWWDKLPLNEGMLCFFDCGSNDDTPCILERLKRANPFICVVLHDGQEGFAEKAAVILDMDNNGN